ncbi:heat-inducible transcriptional repressor HrcA [Nitratidesulfovibrio sp. HK-II]|uniref:heat-inducible transcriptional repressor HrcA n=1 Tax=Nitratidesulfovibrio sp. HK-II TaxID=2009266 RepID=UPI000E2F0F34|nr:heat-inducible transcriptional repressor HrcA [Nitratidesulfovibrio sp. HK-II]
MPTLGQRETQVLATIIESYIASASPVGSRAVAEHSGLRLSPASMRATMSDLTDLGYLEQPHTSAGRVPTARAFRLYVDSLLRPLPLGCAEREAIADELTRQELEISGILRRAANLLSGHARQLGMVVAPSEDEARWRSIEFAPAAEGLVLAVLMLEGGLVRTRTVRVDERYAQDELVRFGNYLNEHFRGLPLSEARDRIGRELARAGSRLEEMCMRALALSRRAVEHMGDDRELIVNGTLNMLEHAEFTDVSRMRDLLTAIEERSRLLELLDRTLSEKDVRITFCQDVPEGAPDGLRGCSVVSAPYGGDTPRGVVSVVGPLRMDYAKIVPVVQCVSRSLTQLFRERFAAAPSLLP